MKTNFLEIYKTKRTVALQEKWLLSQKLNNLAVRKCVTEALAYDCYTLYSVTLKNSCMVLNSEIFPNHI